MLSFEEKKAIFDSYEELTATKVSMNRLNYHFKDSAVPKTMAVRFLHPNGNALIYAGYLPKEETDKGYISVRDETEETIRSLVDQAIAYLKKTADGYEEGYTELWFDNKGDILKLVYDNPTWLVTMPNDQVEGVFHSKDAAEGYLMDEEFFEG